ncbi:MAG TPA: PP2C family serine/threonine-protein phosphatase [Gammaproteobacteria bacterium]|nr:PP2C family serine/threonine-protein phosphatase [Gammaproteobacteria bacterium]
MGTNKILTCFNAGMNEPKTFPCMAGQVIYFSTPARDKETANEDALAIIPVGDEGIVLAVADGLGGMPAGEDASRLVIDYLVKSLAGAAGTDISTREIILNSIEQANNAILQLKNSSATTLVVAEIQGRSLRTYHAGDSMIMLLGNRGKIKYSAIPHSPTGYALISGIINESEAMLDEERHFISNYIGSQDMRVEVGPVLQMAVRDTLLLSSDGVSDNMFDHEVVETVRKGSLQKAAVKLVTDCQRYMSQEVSDRTCHPDDLSFILFRPGKSGS